MNVSTVVTHDLDPTILARYIRVHPGYDTDNLVCMRLELYGCVVEQGL
jgi:chorismate mutase